MEEELQRLRRGYAILSSVVTVLLLALLAIAGWQWLTLSVRQSLSPQCFQSEDGGVRFSATSDGPFVVTHVVGYGPKGRNVAALPEPVASIESGGYEIPLAVLKKLHWYGADSKVSVEFPEGSTWRVLYLRAEYSREK